MVFTSAAKAQIDGPCTRRRARASCLRRNIAVNPVLIKKVNATPLLLADSVASCPNALECSQSTATIGLVGAIGALSLVELTAPHGYYWDGSLGVPSPVEGAPASYSAAFLALAKASVVTFNRVVLGVAFGLAAGVGLGIIVSTSTLARQLVAPSVHILRMTPFLAMIPLFNLWFGARPSGSSCSSPTAWP